MRALPKREKVSCSKQALQPNRGCNKHPPDLQVAVLVPRHGDPGLLTEKGGSR
jgi:hypothetical protein